VVLSAAAAVQVVPGPVAADPRPRRPGPPAQEPFGPDVRRPSARDRAADRSHQRLSRGAGERPGSRSPPGRRLGPQPEDTLVGDVGPEPPGAGGRAIEAADGLDSAIAAVGAALEAELARARAAAAREEAFTAQAAPLAVASRLVEVVERTAEGERLMFDIEIDEALRAPTSEDVLTEMLGALIENAARFARRQVRVSGDLMAEGLACPSRMTGPASTTAAPRRPWRAAGGWTRPDRGTAWAWPSCAIWSKRPAASCEWSVPGSED
jgi:DNA-binding protein YbaB